MSTLVKVRIRALLTVVVLLAMMTGVLSLSVTSAAKPRKYTAWVAVDDGANLILRSRPSPQAANLRALPSGTSLTIKGATVTALNVALPPSPTPYGYVPPTPIPAGSVGQGMPYGYLEHAIGCGVDGWAVDAAAPNESVTVRLSVGAASGQQIFQGATNLARQDVTNATGASGPSGFSIQFGSDSGLLDGQPHTIFAVAIGHNGQALLTGSPQTITCAATTSSTPPLLDQYWLFVEDDSKPDQGVAIGWVNAWYVYVVDDEKTPTPTSLEDASLHVLDVTDLVQRGYVKSIAAQNVEAGQVFAAGTPGAPTVSASSKVTLATARAVVVGGALNPGVGLNLREAPSVNSRALTEKPLPQGTRLTVMARSTDSTGNWIAIEGIYWMMVNYVPDGSSKAIVGFVDSTFVTPVDDTVIATALPSPSATPTVNALPAATAVLPTIPAVPTVVVPKAP